MSKLTAEELAYDNWRRSEATEYALSLELHGDRPMTTAEIEAEASEMQASGGAA